MAASPTIRSSKAVNVRRATTKQKRQQHVLDVSVRTSQVSRLRQRMLFRVFAKFLLVFVVVAALYFGARKGIATLLMKNPDYNVGELAVETDGVLTPETVLAAADLHKGSNIFLVNLNRAKARVEAIPQVEKAQIIRQLPNRITVQINERKPVAWIAPEHSSAGRDEIVSSPLSHLVDSNGIILPSNNLPAQDRYLPVIRNYTAGPRSDGQEVEGEEIKAALDLLHAHQESMIGARFQIQEIDLAKHFGLQVTDRNGLQVLFGLEDMERQLKRLDTNLQLIDQSGQKPQTINLLVQKNVPVTFVTEPSATPPTAPLPSSPASDLSNVSKPGTTTKAKTTSATKDKEKTKEKSKSHRTSASSENHHPQKTRHGLQPFGATP